MLSMLGKAYKTSCLAITVLIYYTSRYRHTDRYWHGHATSGYSGSDKVLRTILRCSLVCLFLSHRNVRNAG
ncbi:MAG: hypothetical protein J7L11_04345 [Thermoprotei archaeon]|nr:hypothetical protein [Thermoprotei archaeon]